MEFRATCRALLLATGLALSGCAGPPGVALQPDVDLSRYAGHWYILANIPYFAENGKVGGQFDISLRGTVIRDDYIGYPHDFSHKPFKFRMIGHVVPGYHNAYWQESPLWPLRFAYLILYVDPDYQTALVGYPGLAYGWILARKPTLPPAQLAALRAKLAAVGYDVAKFRMVPQQPDQIGQPGFQ